MGISARSVKLNRSALFPGAVFGGERNRAGILILELNFGFGGMGVARVFIFAGRTVWDGSNDCRPGRDSKICNLGLALFSQSSTVPSYAQIVTLVPPPSPISRDLQFRVHEDQHL